LRRDLALRSIATVTSEVDRETPRGGRAALRLLQLGALAVVVAVTTFHAFELDRFFAPKELVLHLTAVAAGMFALRGLRWLSFTRVDRLLLAYVALSAVSALFATNRWLSFRALAISASAILVFWIARLLREAGLARPLLNALAIAIVLVAVTSLLQTYGLDTELFSTSRAPGGTLGNRNFIAHAAAFGLPLVLLAALRGMRGASLGVALVIASLVLTRSRAAWLAFAVVIVVMFVAMLASPPLRRDRRTWRRLAAIALIVVIGVAAALLLPNTLRWRSDNPYLETVKRVADYQQGSGHGRLIQYKNSLLMAARHSILGVGPGNWPVEYPAHVRPRDPSMNESEPGMTFNPWPSSDWIAFISERGLLAAALLLLAILTIAIGGVRQLRAARDAEEGLVAVALLGTVAGAGVAGAFDAVLLIALPTIIVWTALGALWFPTPSPQRLPIAAIVAVLLLVLAGAVRSSMQLAAMQTYVTHSDRTALERASRLDPGNYRLHLRLARMGHRDQRCEHARAALALFPNAAAARAAMRGCS
jgi:O-antigen ligase